MSNPKSRREFLTVGMAGKSRMDSEAETGQQQQMDLSRHQKSYLESYKKNAMACQFEFLFNLHQYQLASSAALAAFEKIDALEAQMTVYRDSSEISYINQNAAEETVRVEAGLYELIRLAKEIHHDTGGAFDVTSWPLSELWGFSRRAGKVPNGAEIAETLQSVGGEHINLLANLDLKFAQPGVRINLGGIGKGYALDQVVRGIEEKAIADFVIHGGQSSVVARGNCHEEAGAQPWRIGLTHPINAGERLAEIALVNSALGTSGSGRQGFFHAGKRYGHIIDPRTGWPTNHFLSTTVICDSAAVADALATAFFVMSIEDVDKYCRSNPEIKAILVIEGTAKGTTKIEIFNMDSDEFKISG